MIYIDNVIFHYCGQKTNVFDGFSLQLEDSKIYGLLGQNGAGKSTLLYLITGLLFPSSGSVRCDDIPVCRRSPELLKEIFFLTEEFQMPPISLREYIRLYSPFYSRFSESVLLDCLQEFGLTDDLYMAKLSMGQRKKVYISFALATQTKYLFMDEPTNGLDIPSKTLFRRVMEKHVSQGRTVIISTHQVHDVEQLLDHVLMLKQSSLVVNSSVEELSDQYVFGHLTSEDNRADILYSESSQQGEAVMMRRRDGVARTPVNLELLFNYMIQKK